MVIDSASTTDALRITQAGSGNALVVEDSTNPDSTPFVISSTGKVIKGATAEFSSTSALVPGIQIQATNVSDASFGQYIFSNDANGVRLDIGKSRGSIGGQGLVSSGDTIAIMRFSASDGASMFAAAEIQGIVDATAATNSMPGRIVFRTTATSATSTTERLRIDSKGNISVGTAALATSATDGFLYIASCAGAPTGVPTSFTGRVPMIYDTTNNKFYVYNTAWKSVTLA